MQTHSLPLLRRSAGKVLSYVLDEMFPGLTLIKSGATEQGFYCDFLADRTVDSHMLVLIEEKMRGVIKSDLPIDHLNMVRANAIELFRHHKQHGKAQIISASTAPLVSVLRIGKFYDLSEESVVESTGELSAFKLIAFNRMATQTDFKSGQNAIRILGIVGSDPQKLKEAVKKLKHLQNQGSAKAVEEKKIFSFNPEIGDLAWCWHPDGYKFKANLISLWREQLRFFGYQFISTPPLVKLNRLSEASPEVDLGGEYEGIQYRWPATLSPSHALLFRSLFSKTPSQPVKWAECALISPPKSPILPENPLPSLVHSDYAHLFCSLEEAEAGMISSLQFIDKMTRMFGFGSHWVIVGRGTKFSGTAMAWDQLMECARNALTSCGHEVHENNEEAAFSGPKLQGYLIDSHGREWLGPSIAVDLNLPQKLHLQTPLMIVTRMFGSIERFISILLEHNGPQEIMTKLRGNYFESQ